MLWHVCQHIESRDAHYCGRHPVRVPHKVGLARRKSYAENMAVKLNKKAFDYAKSLINEGKVVHDERDDWSEAAPSADDENKFIEKHGFDEYSKWHLGVDASKPDDTKGHYSFPFGDFKKVRRG